MPHCNASGAKWLKWLIMYIDVYIERIMGYSEHCRSHGEGLSESNAADALIGRLVSIRRGSLGRARSVWKAFRNREAQEQVEQIITTPRTS